MSAFKPPEMKPREPVMLDYRSPPAAAGPADLVGAAALCCCVLCFGAIMLAIGGSYRVRTPAGMIAFILPLAAIALGSVVKGKSTPGRPTRTSVASAAVWLGSIQLVLVVCGSLFIPRSHPHAGSNRVKCGSNLRQIGLAIQMYANDNRGLLPPDLEAVMVTQDLTSEVFVCPSSNDERAVGPTTQAVLREFRKPGFCSYVLASPKPANATVSTAAHVWAYEPLANHNRDGMNVLFGDGHVEWIGKAEAAHLIAELNAGFNPPRKK